MKGVLTYVQSSIRPVITNTPVRDGRTTQTSQERQRRQTRSSGWNERRAYICTGTVYKQTTVLVLIKGGKGRVPADIEGVKYALPQIYVNGSLSLMSKPMG